MPTYSPYPFTEGRPGWVDLDGWSRSQPSNHPSTNRARLADMRPR